MVCIPVHQPGDRFTCELNALRTRHGELGVPYRLIRPTRWKVSFVRSEVAGSLPVQASRPLDASRPLGPRSPASLAAQAVAAGPDDDSDAEEGAEA